MQSLPPTRKIRQRVGKFKFSLLSILVIPLILQVILMGVTIANICHDFNVTNQRSLWLLFSSLILAIASGIVFFRWAIEPITQIISVSQAMVLGDFTRHLKPSNILEINNLGSSINSVREYLQDDFNSVTKKIQEHTQTLIEAKEAAEKDSHDKSQLLASMSHELRTPLNAILGFTELMTQDISTNKLHQEYLEVIHQSGEHLLDLINNMLDLSKIEAGRMSLNFSKFNFRQTINSIDAMLRKSAVSKGLELYFEISEQIPQYIITDEGKLRQILINLISNAIQYTYRGRCIVRTQIIHLYSIDLKDKLDLIPEGQKVTFPQQYNYRINFVVEDTGLGIDEADMEHLFQPFVQTKTGKISQQGTGLGLSITYNLVRLMDGDIFASSAIEQGSTFRFYIPIEVCQVN